MAEEERERIWRRGMSLPLGAPQRRRRGGQCSGRAKAWLAEEEDLSLQFLRRHVNTRKQHIAYYKQTCFLVLVSYSRQNKIESINEVSSRVLVSPAPPPSRIMSILLPMAIFPAHLPRPRPYGL